jgi:hypothetical protein
MRRWVNSHAARSSAVSLHMFSEIQGDVPPTFEVGLALAGAASAGAYSAGVLEFLIEALDTWHGGGAILSDWRATPQKTSKSRG